MKFSHLLITALFGAALSLSGCVVVDDYDYDDHHHHHHEPPPPPHHDSHHDSHHGNSHHNDSHHDSHHGNSHHHDSHHGSSHHNDSHNRKHWSGNFSYAAALVTAHKSFHAWTGILTCRFMRYRSNSLLLNCHLYYLSLHRVQQNEMNTCGSVSVTGK